MRITIGLQDDLADRYRQEADDRSLPLESVLEQRLAAATPLDPRDRFVIVGPPVLGALEAKIGGGHVQDAGDLFMKVQRLANLTFEGHEIRLTPGQIEELTWRAQKLGKTFEQMVDEAYQAFSQSFFSLVP